MTLSQLMVENPAAKIELDAQLKASFEAGKTEGKESMQKTISAAAAFLGPDASYPAPIKSLAVDVLNGTKSAEALLTTVAAFDALKESQKSDAAKADSAQAGETPGEQAPKTSDNGMINNEADLLADIARMKAQRGEV